MKGIVRFLVGDRTGKLITELEPDVGPISWRLNDVGRCQFALARTDAKAVESNLRYGNRVLIYFDNGLPAWGGVIDTPRAWEGGVITCNAYSGEYLLGFRQTDKGRYFSGVTVGAIFQALIDEANQVEPMGLELGSVWIGGVEHSPEYHFGNLLDICKDSLCTRLSNSDFDVTASEAGGKIIFTANFYERKGADKGGVLLEEGYNLTDNIKLAEQGKIVNWWDMAGAGDGWGDDRLLSNSADDTSKSVYDLRQDAKVYSDVSIQGTLDAHADNALAESKDPHRILELEAVNDVDPATNLPRGSGFSDYGVGDAVRVVLESYGFGGTDENVRILAREFNQATGACKLVVRINE